MKELAALAKAIGLEIDTLARMHPVWHCKSMVA